jgi:hypothetical protein
VTPTDDMTTTDDVTTTDDMTTTIIDFGIRR